MSASPNHSPLISVRSNGSARTLPISLEALGAGVSTFDEAALPLQGLTGATQVLILSEADVAPLLSMADAVEAVERAFVAYARGGAVFPARTIVNNGTGVLGAMPGAIRGDDATLGAKLVTVFNGNAKVGKHTHNAVIALFSPDTGEPTALLDGRYITEIRTAAASVVATRALARKEASVVAILGTGVQARAHIDAMRMLPALRDIRVWGRDARRAEELAAATSDRDVAVTAVTTIADACRDAHVICTVTASADPVLELRHVEPGAHINAVGACTPRARELTAELVSSSRIFCDSRDGALSEAGDILLAIRDGGLPKSPDIGLLGDVVAGKAAGRTSATDITLYESLGIAIEDLVCAELVYNRAIARGKGVLVDL